MANRVSASIELGGSVTHTDYLELAGIIAAEGLSTKWDGPAFTPDARTEGERLRLFAHEVAGGTFDELEGWCVEKGLPFARWCGGYGGEWTAERKVFIGSGMPRFFTADEDDRILIDRGDVEGLGSMEALAAYFDAADFAVPPLTIVPADLASG